jgi:hypothetical protein
MRKFNAKAIGNETCKIGLDLGIFVVKNIEVGDAIVVVREDEAAVDQKKKFLTFNRQI